MRIAFIVGCFPCMSETFILKQIAGVIDRGHEVDIFARQRGSLLNLHPEIDKYHMLSRTSYSVSVPSNYVSRIIKGAVLAFVGCFRNPLAVVRSLNLFKYGRKSASLRLLYQTFPFVGKGAYDVIHCHFGPNGNIGMLSRKLGAIHGKLVTTFHGYDVSSYVRRCGEDVYCKLFEECETITFNSESTRERLIKLGCPNNKLIKLPMGVNLSKFSFKLRKLMPGEKVRILSVGRLVEMKGREYAIRALAKVIKTFPEISYTIVGDGILRLQLEELVRALDLEKYIRFTGWVTQAELDDIYESAHLFLHPSITASDGNTEGQGVVLLEAQACGLPVLATQHGAFSETVVENESAFLVKERDLDALADKMLYLIENPELWPEMGRRARRHVESKYDINKLNDRLVNIYQEILTK